MTFDYDLFVIGGGSGGVRAARVAAAGGAKVALAEEFRMGGTCVIRGCVPKKLMVFASSHAGAVADAAMWGWDVTAGDFDWPTFQASLSDELSRLEAIYDRNASNAGVTILHQRAQVTGTHDLRLADGTDVSAKHIVVATGGTPFVPDDVQGAELALTSNEIFDIATLPKRLLIVGGGYIASEFAGIFNGLGSNVTQFYRGTQILRGFDDEARELIADSMITRGVDLRLGADVAKLEKSGDAIKVTAKDGSIHEFDAVLYATGRKPNTQGLGLEAAGVALKPNGAVVVDDYSQTNVPSIYAIGDVTDRVQLTPVAIREAMAFVDTVFNAKPTKPDHALIPTAVFTQPEYGTIGLSEEQAAAEGKIEVYSTAFTPMQNSFLGKSEKVLFKLVVDAASRVVVGAHIVGPGAGEMIQLLGVAVKMGATKEDFDRTVAVHPTMAEEMVLMKEPIRKT